MADINNSTNNTIVAGDKYYGNNLYNSGNNVTIEGAYKYDSSSDYIENRGTNVEIYGYRGRDEIWNYGDNAYISNGDQNDKTYNYGKNTTIYSGYGNDTITTYGDGTQVILGTDNNNVNAFANNVVVRVSRGNQTIQSKAGTGTSIQGGAADDNITIQQNGGNGVVATVSGGTGNDTFIGSEGAEVFVYAQNDGNDVIYNWTSNDTLILASGSISESTSNESGDVVLAVGYDSITLKNAVGKNINVTKKNVASENYYVGGNTTNSTIVAGDKYYGNNLYNSGNNVTVEGAYKYDSSSDYIENRGTNVEIYGYRGRDEIWNFGDNVYIDNGDQTDRVTNYGKNTKIYSGYGNDTITTYGDSTQVTLGTDNNSVNAFANNVVVKVSRGNQTIQSKAGTGTSIQGGVSDDNITIQRNGSGSGVVATVNGGTGNDTFTGSAGAEVFVYAQNDGNDVIYGWTSNDTLVLTSGSISESTTTDEGDVIFGIGYDSITLKDAASKTINISLPGSTPTPPKPTPTAIENYNDNTLVSGTSSADTIINYGSYVTIKGGKGNDTLIGNDYDADVFLFAKGDGSDVITNYGSDDTIKITGGTYTKTTVSNDVIISVGDTGQIALKNAKGKIINIDGTLAGGNSNKVSIPSDAVTYNGHSYKLYTIGKTWSEAKTYCENLGGHLVAINTSGEQSIIESMISNGTKNSYWLGGYRDDNDNWQWVTNESFNYSNWAPSEPNNSGGEEDKIMIYKVPDPKNPDASFGEWNDITDDCGEGEYPSTVYGKNAFGFICEWDTISTKTTVSTTVTVTNATSSPVTVGSAVKVINATSRTTAVKITGNALANTIRGGSGVDTIYGGAGNDSILGNNGNDKLFGDAGNDKLLGGNGADTLTGGKGNDSLTGGAGNDVFIYAFGDGNDVITDYTAGQDKIKITGARISRTSVSGSDVILTVGSGKITVKNGKGKRLSIYNNSNSIINTIIGSTIPSGRYITNYYNSGAGNYAVITGTAYNDTIYNSADYVKINAGAGNDSINSSVGYYTTINGGKGNDTIYGCSSYADVFQYTTGDGNDIIYNYDAKDKISLSSSSGYSTTTSGQDIVVNIGSGSIKLKNAKGKKLSITGGYKTGNNNDDTISSNSVNIYNTTKNITISGSSSKDTIKNAAGGVKIYAGADNDSIYSSVLSSNTINSSYGYVTIDGGAGNDTIYSGDPYVSINGGAGNDSININSWRNVTIKGSTGNDTINLGYGYNDIVQYSNGDGNDVILGYKYNDTIQISGSSYSTQVSGNDVIIKVGSGQMILKDAKGSTLNITRTSNYEERWFLESPSSSILNDELSSILDSTSNGSSIDYKFSSENNFISKYCAVYTISMTSNQKK